jgi:hypothetical protein
MTLTSRRRARPLRAAMALGIVPVMALSITRLVPLPTSAAAEAVKGVAGACDATPKVGANWWYNWYVEPGSCQAGEFVPMISGEGKRSPGDIDWQMGRVKEGGYKTVLGFNEPDRAKSNMTVEEAVSLWPRLTADPSIRVGSPATTAGSGGTQWFANFMRQADARKLRVDFVAVHWYGWNKGSCDANAKGLDDYLKWAEGMSGNRPIWITEFGCLNQSNTDTATVTAFLKGALKVIANHPCVERYAWYPYDTHNELLDSAGALTPLGEVYAGARSAPRPAPIQNSSPAGRR